MPLLALALPVHTEAFGEVRVTVSSLESACRVSWSAM